MAKNSQESQNGEHTLDPSILGELTSIVNKKDDRKERDRLAKALESRGLVDDDMLKAAFRMSKDESAASLKNALISMNMVTQEDIMEAVEADMGMKRIKLADIVFSSALLAELPPDIVKRYRVLPVRVQGSELWVALSDPSNVRAIDDLGRIVGKHIHGMIATEEEIDKAIRTHYDNEEVSEIYDEIAENETPQSSEIQYLDVNKNVDFGADTPLLVQYVDTMFRESVRRRASDIHIEPTRHGLVIRIRVDGHLTELPMPKKAWQNNIIARLKVLANLDLAEKRIPLDGRIKLNMPDKKLDLRVSTLPTIYGESIVMRILDQSSVMLGLEDVGFLPDTVRMFNNLINSPTGILLMTGPTGSGKTTTLYAALGVLNTPEVKITTLEDPIEYQLAGINQVQINNEVGLTFPVGLRGLLRQSPDVILVGEIRDLETAENAIRAALTGHMVFSTLHTNDAPGATVRLIDMGVKPYLVASSLQAVIAQRLARRVCTGCKEVVRLKPEEFLLIGYSPDEYEDHVFYKGRGCERCSQTGYRGRVALHEVFTMDAELRRRVIRCEATTKLKRYAVSQGMRTLRMDGWQKVLLGITTVDAVVDLTGTED